jgi:ATP-dependent DNA ligase
MNFNDFIYLWPEKPVLVHRDQDLVDQLSDDPDYVAEPKFNGQRCVVHTLDGKISFWSRHGAELKYALKYGDSEGYKALVKMLKTMFPKGYWQFDGELRHNKVQGIYHKLVVWDCFVYKNRFLYKEQFWARRELLAKHFDSGHPYEKLDSQIHLITQYKTDFRRHFKDYTEGVYGDADEFEGLVMKSLKGKLNLGRKSSSNSLWMRKIRKATGRHRY